MKKLLKESGIVFCSEVTFFGKRKKKKKDKKEKRKEGEEREKVVKHVV